VPRRPLGIAACPVIVALARAWDLTIATWTELPGRATAELTSRRDVVRASDLPPGTLDAMLDVTERSSITERVVAELWDEPLAPIERAWVAFVADRRLDDDTEIALWLNVSDFEAADGTRVVGIEAAARRFFGKRCTELDADEARLLATMLEEHGMFADDAAERGRALTRGALRL
jgi:hypothetical protein